MSEKDKKKDDKTPTDDSKKEKPDREIVIRNIFEKGKGFEPATPPPKDNPEDNPEKDKPPKDDKPPVPPAKPEKIEKPEGISTEEFEKMKRRAEEAEAIIALEAEKAFTDEKTKFLEGIEDEDKRKEIEEDIGDDPEKLEDWKRTFEAIAIKTPAPTPPPKPKDDEGEGEGEGEGEKPKKPPEKPKTEEELFKEEKDALLSKIEDEDRKEEVSKSIGDDPKTGRAKIADIRMWTGIIERGFKQAGVEVTGTKRTTGKATLPITEGQAEAKDWIDSLYATMKDPSKSKDEKTQANRMLDEIWFEVLKGLSMRAKQGKGYTGFQVMTCPECGNAIMAPRGIEILECDNCGWKKYPKGKKLFR